MVQLNVSLRSTDEYPRVGAGQTQQRVRLKRRHKRREVVHRQLVVVVAVANVVSRVAKFGRVENEESDVFKEPKSGGNAVNVFLMKKALPTPFGGMTIP